MAMASNVGPTWERLDRLVEVYRSPLIEADLLRAEVELRCKAIESRDVAALVELGVLDRDSLVCELVDVGEFEYVVS